MHTMPFGSIAVPGQPISLIPTKMLTQPGAARTRSEVLFGELAKLVGDRTVMSQHHRSISDGLPTEAIADHVHGAVGGPARDPCPGAGPTLFIRQPKRELQLHVPMLLKVRHGDGQERDRLLARMVRKRRADELLGDFSKERGRGNRGIERHRAGDRA